MSSHRACEDLQAAVVAPGTPPAVHREVPAWRRLVGHIELSWGYGGGRRIVSVHRRRRCGVVPFVIIPICGGGRILRDVRGSSCVGKCTRGLQSGSLRRRWNFRSLTTEIVIRHHSRQVERVQVELGNRNSVLFAHSLYLELLHLDLALEPRAIYRESVCRCHKKHLIGTQSKQLVLLYLALGLSHRGQYRMERWQFHSRRAELRLRQKKGCAARWLRRTNRARHVRRRANEPWRDL